MRGQHSYTDIIFQETLSNYAHFSIVKGQLNLKCPFDVIVSTKIPSKSFNGFCTSLQIKVKSKNVPYKIICDYIKEKNNKCLCLFLILLFLEARTEFLTKISLVFWSIYRHQKDILKLTDL